ncbi:MarR family winged helix-turn-helix transcriptional regulator [Kineococcus terrestris]|uniref:MarR family winged helix-turn-helix transcriptional regulator n=1 Tax=Kineococcus terrestris TaxID=2044856 RepID=UPI0034DAE262
MATPHACSALVDVLPGVLRTRRALAGPPGAAAALSALAAVHELGGPRVSELADHLGLDLSTVSRKVAHLRRLGLLEAVPDPDDGRSHRLSTSAAGLAELREQRRRLVGRLVDHLDDWDDDDLDRLTGLLGRFGRPAGPPGAGEEPRPTTRTQQRTA